MIFRRDPQKKLDRKLVKAAMAGNADETLRLLEAGANPNVPYHYAGCALFAAAYNGDHEGYLRTIDILLAHGAEVDARNSVNCTALMGAADKGNLRAVQALLAAGADRELRGRDRNALDWAMTSGNAELIALLQAKPAEPAVEGPDEVILRRRVGNRLLEEVFDFAGRERITFVRKDEESPVEAVSRDGFSAIDDRGRLREAFRRYAQKGGSVPESEIFSEVLAKPCLPRKDP